MPVPRRSRARFLALPAILAAALASAATPGSAATSSVVIGADVASATNITASGCATGAAPTLITASPGIAAMTAADCVVGFGSSNDTASLHVSQRDGRGRALYRPTVGGLDPAFGSSGRTITASGTGKDLFTTVARDADGMFVAAGTYYNGTRQKIVVGRFRADGTLDPLFNGGALRQISLTTTDEVAYSVAVQRDRKILLGGLSSQDSLLMRLNVDGSTEWSQVNNLGTGSDWVKGVALQPDGRLLVYGIAYTGANNVWNTYLERRSATDGALDPTFGTGGRLVVSGLITAASPQATVNPPIVQPDGRIVVCDYTTANGNPDLWVLRTLADGTFDPDFGTSGRTTIPGAANDYCGVGARQDDGMFVFPSATTTALGVGSVRVVRVRADGTLDPGFGSSGIAAPALGDAYVGGLLLQEDQRILAFGFQKSGSTYLGMSARLLPGGALDTSHGTGGAFTVAIGNPTIPPEGGASAFGADGAAVTASGQWNGSNLDTVIYQLGTANVPDYGGTTTWSSAGGAFGACLASVTGTGATGGWTPGGGSCTTSDNGTWYGIPAATTGGSPSLVARSTSANQTGSEARLRFALRAAAAQETGSYIAPVTFQVVAPML